MEEQDSIVTNLFAAFVLIFVGYGVPLAIWLLVDYFFPSREAGGRAWLLRVLLILATVISFAYLSHPLITKNLSLPFINLLWP
jgi:hypothetical protein